MVSRSAKQLGTPAAAGQRQRWSAGAAPGVRVLAHWTAKHTGHPGGIGSDHELGIAALIVDPINGTCGCGGDGCASHRPSNRVFTVIGPTYRQYRGTPAPFHAPAMRCRAISRTQLIAALREASRARFSAQSLTSGHAIQTDNAPQFSKADIL